MRIGLVTSEFPPDLGGVETYAYQLAAELGRRDRYEVTVYAPPSAAHESAPPGVRVRPILSSCRARDWSRLRNEPIDLWHALSAPHCWLGLTGRPTVVSVHGNDFLAPYALTARPQLSHRIPTAMQQWIWRRFKSYWQTRTRALIAEALPYAAAIFSNSRYTAEVLEHEIGGCASRLTATGVGVDARFFDTTRQGVRGRRNLLTVSRLSEPRKNVDIVLRALAQLKERYDFIYTVAGEGTQRAELESLTAALGLSDRVLFAGRVDDHELRRLYAAADLFVLTASVIPGSHEGFGIVYLEAAAAGVPSLAARLAGAVEAVADGVSGYFVDATSPDAVEHALERFLSGDVTFDEDSCREFARGFVWPTIADQIIQHYHATLRTHRTHASSRSVPAGNAGAGSEPPAGAR